MADENWCMSHLDRQHIALAIALALYAIATLGYLLPSLLAPMMSGNAPA